MLVLYILTMSIAHICDALKDAYYWNRIHGGGQLDCKLINKRSWHPIKNIGKVAWILSGVCLVLASHNILHGLYLILLIIPLTWSLWEMTYHFALYGTLWGDKDGINLPMGDIRITINHWSVFHISLWVMFATLLYMEVLWL